MTLKDLIRKIKERKAMEIFGHFLTQLSTIIAFQIKIKGKEIK